MEKPKSNENQAKERERAKQRDMIKLIVTADSGTTPLLSVSSFHAFNFSSSSFLLLDLFNVKIASECF